VPKVRRYAGDDRYGTAAAVAGLYDAPVQTVFVTTGRTFPDALAASARAASLGVPVLMTSRDELREQTRRQLERLSPESVVVVGGPASVNDDVLDLIDDAVGSGTARRLGGANRYEVAAKVATEVESSDTVFIATGMKFPDALGGSAWAGATDAPLLLVQQDRVPQATIGQLERLSPERIVVLGGPATISGSVVTQLGGYGDVERVGGANRWEVAASVAGRFPDAEPASVASGRTWPDALAGAARAGGGDAPIILVDTDGIPAASRAQLRRLGPLSIEIYGGRDTVSRDVFYELKDLYE
jgi:putative cell wall-binding protein